MVFVVVLALCCRVGLMCFWFVCNCFYTSCVGFVFDYFCSALLILVSAVACLFCVLCVACCLLSCVGLCC